MSIEEQFVKFIKKVIFELSCINKIDHRFNDLSLYKSRLREDMAQNNYENVDLVIANIVKEFVAEDYSIGTIKYLLKKSSDKNQKEDEDEDEYGNKDVDEDEDTYDEVMNDFYNEFIQSVGLYEVFSLHGDDGDRFQDDFIKIFTN